MLLLVLTARSSCQFSKRYFISVAQLSFIPVSTQCRWCFTDELGHKERHARGLCVSQLAIRVANEESLLVARLDGTMNEVPGVTVPRRLTGKAGASEDEIETQPDPVSVHGYPVVIFFAKKAHQHTSKVPIVYKGPRNADALRNFVTSQTALQAHEDL